MKRDDLLYEMGPLPVRKIAEKRQNLGHGRIILDESSRFAGGKGRVDRVFEHLLAAIICAYRGIATTDSD